MSYLKSDEGCAEREDLSDFVNNRLCVRNRKVIIMTGEVLKRMRAIYGYKAKDLCQELDISPSYLSEIENGKKQPTLELLERYAKIFNIKLSSLILLSERYDDAANTGMRNDFIRNMMMSLINRMSAGIEDETSTYKI